MDHLEKYRELYEVMAQSGEPKKMKIFGDAERWAFELLAGQYPSIAEKWLRKLEAVDWNNYLSEEEMNDINAGIVNQSGKKGPIWTLSQIENSVRNLGGDAECAPTYNKYALAVMMNTIASDHMESLREFIPESDLQTVIYRMAVEKLQDPDRPEFVRDYFHI